jgi:TPR repeat protein
MDVEIVNQAALNGDAEAQLMLGFLYEWGYGVAFDQDEAMFWYSKAAESGSAISQYALGLRLSEQGESSKEKAVEWITQSANKNLAAAQEKLAACYEFGIGLPADTSLAIDWYVKAAKGGSSEAARRLAELFDTGKYVERNGDQALMWYKSAADLGDAGAAFILASKYHNDTSDPTNESSSLYWFQRAADLGHSQGHAMLMLAYSKGLMGLPRDKGRTEIHREMMERCRQKEKRCRAAQRGKLLALIQEHKDSAT